MRKIGVFLLSAILMVSLFSGTAFALPPSSTTSWEGQTISVDESTLTDGMDLIVTASLYISTDFSSFDTCNLTVSYDKTLLELSNARITVEDNGYMLLPQDMAHGYNVVVMNLNLDAPAADGYCCKLNFRFKLLDADALRQAGSAEIDLGLFNDDLTVYQGADKHNYQANVAGTNTIDIIPVFSPMVINLTSQPYHTISYETNGGSAVTPSSVLDGDSINMPTSTKQGHTLEGWYTDAGLTNKVPNPYIPTGDATLYAKWIDHSTVFYTITYETNGGTAAAPSKVNMETFTYLPTTTRDGYTLEGWYTDAALTDKVDNPYKATADITLYAKWTKNANNTTPSFMVTYETNGGTAVAPSEVDEGSSLNLPASTKDGFVLEGWYTDAALTQKAANPFTPSADTTLYAKWTDAKDATHRITYETNGGTPVAPENLPADKASKLPSTTKDGYTFDGWYSDAGLTQKVADPYTPTADATLYAKWTKNAATTYKITFNSNGGSEVNPMDVEVGTAATLPVPTKSGYSFAGWYTDTALTSKVTSPYTPTADVTLYAKWTAKAGASSVPQTGRNNLLPMLFGTLGVLVLCAGAVVFMQRRRMKREK